MKTENFWRDSLILAVIVVLVAEMVALAGSLFQAGPRTTVGPDIGLFVLLIFIVLCLGLVLYRSNQTAREEGQKIQF